MVRARRDFRLAPAISYGECDGRAQALLRLQEPVRISRLRAGFRAAAALRRRAALDSVSPAHQGTGATQPVLRLEGAVLVHGRAALGEQARWHSHQGATQDL